MNHISHCQSRPHTLIPWRKNQIWFLVFSFLRPQICYLSWIENKIHRNTHSHTQRRSAAGKVCTENDISKPKEQTVRKNHRRIPFDDNNKTQKTSKKCTNETHLSTAAERQTPSISRGRLIKTSADDGRVHLRPSVFYRLILPSIILYPIVAQRKGNILVLLQKLLI